MAEASEDTRQTKYLKWLQNNRFLAILGVIGVLVIGLGAFTNALETIIGPFKRDPNRRFVQEYCELLSPLSVQFDRTFGAFVRYKSHDFAVEGTLEDGNTKARALLETKSQLVPAQLSSARDSLIYHYDRWLEEYRRVRQISRDSTRAFIFVGPAGAPFPQWAERNFRARKDSVLNVLGPDFACN